MKSDKYILDFPALVNARAVTALPLFHLRRYQMHPLLTVTFINARLTITLVYIEKGN